MSQQECIFCKIVSRQIPSLRLFENDSVLAFLDVGPISDGHTLIVPKQHFQRLDKTPPETVAQIARILPMLAAAVQKAMNADGYNLLCNNGTAAGQVVEHLHFHIIPRKQNDGVFNRWPAYKYEEGKAAQIARQIIDNINPEQDRT